MNSNSSESLALLHATLQRLASQSAACKIWATVLGATILLFAAGRVAGETLLWAVAPVLLLALADAGYVGQSRRIADYMARRESKELGNGRDMAALLVEQGDVAVRLGSLASFFSLSVWPYYACLGGLIVGLGLTVLVPKSKGPGSPSPFPQPAFSPGTVSSPNTLQPGLFPAKPTGSTGLKNPVLQPQTLPSSSSERPATVRPPTSSGNPPPAKNFAFPANPPSPPPQARPSPSARPNTPAPAGSNANSASPSQANPPPSAGNTSPGNSNASSGSPASKPAGN